MRTVQAGLRKAIGRNQVSWAVSVKAACFQSLLDDSGVFDTTVHVLLLTRRLPSADSDK